MIRKIPAFPFSPLLLALIHTNMAVASSACVPTSTTTPTDPLIMLLQACAVVDKEEREKDVVSRVIPPNLTSIELASLHYRDLRNLLLPYAPYKLCTVLRSRVPAAVPLKFKPRHRITPRRRKPRRAPDARATHECFMRTLRRLSSLGAASAMA